MTEGPPPPKVGNTPTNAAAEPQACAASPVAECSPGRTCTTAVTTGTSANFGAPSALLRKPRRTSGDARIAFAQRPTDKMAETLARVVDDVQIKAVKEVGRLLDSKEGAEPGSPGFHPDSGVAWNRASAKTRAAVVLVQGAQAELRTKRAGTGGPKVLGLVAIPVPSTRNDEWERFAQSVNDRRASEIIDLDPVALPEKS